MVETLIVEDSVTFRHAIKELLRWQFPFMRLIEAQNAEEAMSIIDATCPDLIIMDIRLPGQNGLDLTKKIKKRYPQVTIMILTDYDLPEYRESAAEHGADCFLSKGSTTADEILGLIEAAIHNPVVTANSKKGGADTPAEEQNGRKFQAERVEGEEAGERNQAGDTRWKKKTSKIPGE
jgi:DNA-binding NarL/FixJ family response regulator